MPDPKSESKAKGLKLVLRGESVEVEFRSRDDFDEASLEGVAPELLALFGTKDLVRVRKLNLDQMERYLFVFHNEAMAIELLCEKPEGWANLLTNESHKKLVEKGQGINGPLFEEWFGRRLERLKMLTGAATDAAASASTNSSRPSSSAPATPANS